MIELDLVKLFVARVPYALPNVRVFERTIIDRVVGIEGRKVRLRSGLPGQGDAWAIVRGGRHIEIEAKSATGKLRVSQLAWQRFCVEWSTDHLVLQAKKDEASIVTVDRWVAELGACVNKKGNLT